MSGSSEPSTSRPRGYGTSSSTSPSRRAKSRETVIDIAASDDEGSSPRMNGHGDRKGKGKQRDIGASGSGAAPAAGVSVNVRFTDGTTEDVVDLFINDSETVRLVKRRIRTLRPDLATNKLRLIYLGRILSDGTRVASWVNSTLARQKQQRRQPSLHEGGIAELSAAALQGVRHAVQSFEGKENTDEKGKGKGKQVSKEDQESPSFGRTIWLHCSVGEAGSLQAEEEEQAASTAALPGADPAGQGESNSGRNTIPLTGFDRLREAGFSEEEITNIRAQFHNDTLGSPTAETAGILEREEQEAQARQLEEQWMEGLGAGGADPNGPSTGMYTTLFKGVVAGFFFPFSPLFFFSNRGGSSAAAGLVGEGSMFSKRMQMAIVAGLSINVLYGALRAFA